VASIRLIENGIDVTALLLEMSVDAGGRHAAFGRAEYVQRTSSELLLTGSVSPLVDLAAVSAGYALELSRSPVHVLGAGVRGTVNLVPAELRPFYGSRTPLGVAVFARLRAGGGCAR
jgi:hypothetical protein